MTNKLFISDERMLKLMQYAIENGYADSESEYMEKINFQRTNILKVRAGIQGFTKEHIHTAAHMTGANINWIFGIESNMMRKPPVKAIMLLKQAVTAVEDELSGKNTKRVTKKK